MRQLLLPVRLRSSSIFDNFFAGPNREAVMRLQSLRLGSKPVVTWVCGPTGVGKTHLLQAICAQASLLGVSSAYLPLADLGGANASPELLQGCEELDLVCVDDVERVLGNDAWERAIFRLYTLLDDRGGCLIVASESTPASVAIRLRDLASRLAAGTILKVQALDDDELGAAISMRGERLGLQLAPDIVAYLLRRLPRNMAVLCELLDELDKVSLAEQRRITLPLVRYVIDYKFAAQGE